MTSLKSFTMDKQQVLWSDEVEGLWQHLSKERERRVKVVLTVALVIQSLSVDRARFHERKC